MIQTKILEQAKNKPEAEVSFFFSIVVKITNKGTERINRKSNPS